MKEKIINIALRTDIENPNKVNILNGAIERDVIPSSANANIFLTDI
ncbi:hypothetical protein AB45_3772 [Escherichia coli 3-105-05_S1_C2]|nr:hypothetical protein AB45_3772 [Escherichia coli 3-105-05_S1_C2]